MLVIKNQTVTVGEISDVGSVPGLGRSPGEGNGNPLQHSCLENPMDRGAWWATVHGVARVGYGGSDLVHMGTYMPFLPSEFINYVVDKDGRGHEERGGENGLLVSIGHLLS